MTKVIMMLVLVFSVALQAKDDKAPSNETGSRFGGIKGDDTKPKRSLEEILEEMLRVQYHQLSTQEKILAILKEQYDPTPKTITLEDGTKCIANSSAKCFDMPLTPTAKRIPVMKNWVTNPTKDTAKEYLKWQAKYIQKISKSATAFDLANAAWGTEASPLNYNGSSFTDSLGQNYRTNVRARAGIIQDLRDDISLYLFLGKNPNLDFYSFRAYWSLMLKIPNIELNIVFYSEESKAAVEKEAKTLSLFNALLKQASSVIVDDRLFRKYNIYTTPTLGVYQYAKDKYDSIIVGKMGSGHTVDKLVGYLQFEGLSKPGDMPAYESWDKYSDRETKGYFDRAYDYSTFDIQSIKEQYKQGIKNKKGVKNEK